MIRRKGIDKRKEEKENDKEEKEILKKSDDKDIY